MTAEEVKEMCREMGIFFDEDHPDHITASKIKTLAPPFMEYFLVEKPVYADGIRYIDINELNIWIYSDTEVSEKESLVMEALEKNELRWKRTSKYIDDLAMWAITYQMEV